MGPPWTGASISRALFPASFVKICSLAHLQQQRTVAVSINKRSSTPTTDPTVIPAIAPGDSCCVDGVGDAVTSGVADGATCGVVAEVTESIADVTATASGGEEICSSEDVN